jgi:hypothetical protein
LREGGSGILYFLSLENKDTAFTDPKQRGGTTKLLQGHAQRNNLNCTHSLTTIHFVTFPILFMKFLKKVYL